MKEELETVKISEWGRDRFTPIILPEGMCKWMHANGQISTEALEALNKEMVVKIAGYWCILSKTVSVTS